MNDRLSDLRVHPQSVSSWDGKARLRPRQRTINNLLRFIIDTHRQRWLAQRRVGPEGITFKQARADQTKRVPARRMGDPREFGAICAFLCSAQAGYISGQSIHVDSGSYPALIEKIVE